MATGTINATVAIETQPAARTVVALACDQSGQWSVAGAAESAADGTVAVSVSSDIDAKLYAVAIDDWGVEFTPSAQVLIGDLIRPTAFAGFVFRVTQAGTLPTTEPEWPSGEGNFTVGTALVTPQRHYQPLAHGPVPVDLKGIAGEIGVVVVGDVYSATLSVSGYQGSAVFSVSAGTLPQGLSISTGGTITGVVAAGFSPANVTVMASLVGGVTLTRDIVFKCAVVESFAENPASKCSSRNGAAYSLTWNAAGYIDVYSSSGPLITMNIGQFSGELDIEMDIEMLSDLSGLAHFGFYLDSHVDGPYAGLRIANIDTHWVVWDFQYGIGQRSESWQLASPAGVGAGTRYVLRLHRTADGVFTFYRDGVKVGNAERCASYGAVVPGIFVYMGTIRVHEYRVTQL